MKLLMWLFTTFLYAMLTMVLWKTLIQLLDVMLMKSYITKITRDMILWFDVHNLEKMIDSHNIFCTRDEFFVQWLNEIMLMKTVRGFWHLKSMKLIGFKHTLTFILLNLVSLIAGKGP